MRNMDQKKLQVYTILIGREGCGKTSVFKEIIDASTQRELQHCCPCKAGISHLKDCDLHIIDSMSSGCSLHHGLTFGQLNGVVVLIEYHPRYGSTMIDCE